MPRISLLTVFWGLAILLLAGCEMSPPPAKKVAAVPPPPGVTSMTAEGFSFGGQRVSLPATTAQLENLFGKPDRVLDKVNRILVWDGRGIYAYCKTDRDEIHDISIAFKQQGYEFDPQNPFPGAVNVGGTPISAATTLAELQAAGFTGEPHLSLEKQLGERVVLAEVDGTVAGLSYSLP
jgi:hypothetical protein